MKWFGKIGYGITEEDEETYVWTSKIIEKEYFGEIIRNSRSYTNSNSVNGEINISQQLSIVSDPFSSENFHLIRYAEFMGTKWIVTNVEVQFPRLLLTLGGVYNGEQA